MPPPEPVTRLNTQACRQQLSAGRLNKAPSKSLGSRRRPIAMTLLTIFCLFSTLTLGALCLCPPPLPCTRVMGRDHPSMCSEDAEADTDRFFAHGGTEPPKACDPVVGVVERARTTFCRRSSALLLFLLGCSPVRVAGTGPVYPIGSVRWWSSRTFLYKAAICARSQHSMLSGVS